MMRTGAGLAAVCLLVLALAGCEKDNGDQPHAEGTHHPATPVPPKPTLLDDLVEAYRTRQPEQWTRAESAIHAQKAEALPMLWQGLESEDRQTRELAAMMLAQVLPGLLYGDDSSRRPDADRIASKLKTALRDESAEVRVNIAVALSLFPEEAPALVPVFEELLASERPHVRSMAVAALGALGAPAAEALPEVERLSETDQDPAVQSAAREALGQLRQLR